MRPPWREPSPRPAPGRRAHGGRPRRGRARGRGTPGDRAGRGGQGVPRRAARSSPPCAASTWRSGEGEFFSLLGPSGCGKTTTMRMIAGFEEPTQGTVRLHGQDVTGVPPNKRDVNMVFQSYALFPHMSVFENVAFGLRRKSVAKAEITRRVGEMLEIVDLAGRERAPPAGAVRRPAAAGRAGPGAGQPPRGAAARRAARRARPQAAPGHAGRAEADPARGRHHVRLRDARPGRGADHVGPDRGHERRGRSSSWARPGRSTSTRRPGSWPASSARPTCSPAPSPRLDGDRAVIEVSPDERIVVPVPDRAGDARATRLELTVRPEKIDLATAPAAGDGCCALRGTVTEVVYLGTRPTSPSPPRPAPTWSSSSRTRRPPIDAAGRGRQCLAVLGPAALIPDRLAGQSARRNK